MKCSMSSWEKSHDHYSWFSWGTSTCQMSAGNTAGRKQSGRFLECVEHSLLTQLVREPTGEGAPLGLLFVNRGGIVGDVMAGGCLRMVLVQLGQRGTPTNTDAVFAARCKVAVGKGAGLPSQVGFSFQGTRSQLGPQHEASVQWHGLWPVA